jgi:acetyl-CoA/propionyl-CoA carboxylase biotin carboxyl carrier protein
VTTNVAFLRRVLADPRVVEGDMDTELVERIAAAAPPPAVPLGASVAAAISSLGIARTGAAIAPWDDSTGWRLGEPAWTHWNATVDGNPVALALRVTAAGLEVDDGSNTRRGSWSMRGDGVDVELDGTRTAMRVERSSDHVWVSALGDTWAFTLPQPVRPDGARAREHATEITSPMPGTVVAVLVQLGEAVEQGQALLVVEAMKMEHTLRAAADGTVAEVLVAAGDRVALNERLAVIEAAASTEEN